jgi:carbon storage regulator
MLLLTRRIGEKLIINNNITVTVLCNRNGLVKLGIDAPPEITVNTLELQLKINQELALYD